MTLHIILRRLQQRHVAEQLFRLHELRRRVFDMRADRIQQLTRPQVGGTVSAGQRENVGVRIAEAGGNDFRLIIGGLERGKSGPLANPILVVSQRVRIAAIRRRAVDFERNGTPFDLEWKRDFLYALILSVNQHLF